MKDGRFYNTPNEQYHSVWWPSFKMYMYSMYNWYKSSLSEIEKWRIQAQVPLKSEILKITWIGHATFLIQIGGINIVTDPVFGHASWLFRRILPPGIHQHQLVPIDIVLLSHNHWDHMDSQSIYALACNNPLFLVPQGLVHWFQKRKIKRVKEFMWWEYYDIGISNVRITFLPAWHWSQRALFDRNKSLWGSWLIQCDDQLVYFAGDTAYSNHFREIGAEYKNITVALIPIGPCEPEIWLSHSHLNAERAGEAFIDLQAKMCIPMHWGTFYFGNDHFLLPVEKLNAWWKQHKLARSNKLLRCLKIGESLTS